MPQFIFTMKDLRKVTPQGKEILKGIWLSFYGDAKIGVLGANGAGKSTLLRIMAGVDKDFAGEAFPAEGTRIGFLPQEPQLDPTKNVLQHVEEAVAEKRKILHALRGDLGQLHGRHRRRVLAAAGPDRRPEPVGPRQAGRDRDGRAAPAAGRRRRHDALGRREAARRALPPAAPARRHAAARRAHEPPRRRVGRLARALPEGVQGQRRRHHPRPLLPRQRGRLDPRARPRRRHPLGGQLLVLARAEGPAPDAGGEGSLVPPPTLERELEWIRLAPARAAGQGQGPHHPLRGAAGGGAGRREARRQARDHRSRRARGSATW